MNDELEVINAVGRALSKVEARGRFADLTLSNGIVLDCRPVPPLLVNAVNEEFQDPPVPKVVDQDKGREIENPNDPAYLDAVTRVSSLRESAVIDLVLAVGTSVKTVPDGYYAPEQDEWIAWVEMAQKVTGRAFAIDRDDKQKRYIAWLRFYALETGTDLKLAAQMPLQLAGINEQEVMDAINSFRGSAERGADNPGAATTNSSNGHNANRAARRSGARA